MRRTTLAIALASGALAIPAVALASGGGDDPAPSSTTPVQQQERQQPRDQQRPDHDCPEPGGRGSDEGSAGGEVLL